jgi:AcrR family transcriptional regulator
VRTADPAKPQRIIDVAIQLFAERPYHEVRMDDIAERAKVAKGTLYLHFKDKEALYRALMLEGLKGLATRLEECVTGEMSPERRKSCTGYRARGLKTCPSVSRGYLCTASVTDQAAGGADRSGS